MTGSKLAFKLGLSVATLLCSAAAMAQSSVTIYGVADIYAEYGKGDATTYRLNSGGQSGSRLGFKGSEDLGGGLSAVFKLEHGYAIDTGTTTQGGRMWGRQAYVGLSGGFGSLTLGRQYTPLYNSVDNDDPFGTGAGSAYSSGILTYLNSRADNSVYYELPKLGGVTGSFMVAAGEGDPSGKLYSGNVHFAVGGFGIGLAAERVDTAEKTTVVSLTGNYDFGAANVMAGVQSVKNLTGVVGAQDDRSEYFAGVSVPFGQSTITAGYGSGKFKDVDGTHASQWSLGYSYALSKRTNLYGVYTDIHNDTLTAYTADTATGSGPAVSAGHNVQALQIGIRHKF